MAIDRFMVRSKSSAENFKKGEELYQHRQNIYNFTLESNEEGREYDIRAYVLEGRSKYHLVDITVNEIREQILYADCNCHEYLYADSDEEEDMDLCRHCVALLLQYIALRDSNAFPGMELGLRSSASVLEMISYYSEREAAQYGEGAEEGRFSLEPSLILHRNKFSLEFKVGDQKKYIVKNLTSFVSSVDNREMVRYGKNLEFLHCPEAFDEKATVFLKFLKEQVREYQYHYGLYTHNYWREGGTPAKELKLSPKALDDFFALVTGQEIYIKDCYNQDSPCWAAVTEGNPRLRFYIKKEVEGIVIGSDPFLLMQGLTRMYILYQSVIYCCDDDFTKNTRAIFAQLSNAAAGGGLFVTYDDFPTFCAKVLPRINAGFQVDAGDLKLEQYMPPEGEYAFYFDYPDEERLTCRAMVTYGEHKYNLQDTRKRKGEYRDWPKEQGILNLVWQYFPFAAPKEHCFTEKADDDSIYRLLDTGLAAFGDAGQLFGTERFKKLNIVPKLHVAVGVSLSGDLLELSIDTGEFSREELAQILKSYKQKKKYYRLKDNSFLRLENSSLELVSQLAGGLMLRPEDLKKESIVVPKFRTLYVDSVLKNSGEAVSVHRDNYFKALVRNIKNVEDSDYEAPQSLRGVLREYQKTGFRWLKTLADMGFSGILADDMGLGKTLQILALLYDHAGDPGELRTSLIVAPASMVYSWENEARTFVPELKVLPITGTAREREEKIASCGEYDVLITSYDLLRRDTDHYARLRFAYQILDEAQYIKNHATVSSKAVKTIDSRVRFALSGTPIENRLSELWSIFDFLMPGMLYTYGKFREQFELPVVAQEDEAALARLKQMIKPFILRRLKSDVLKDLPDKIETVVYTQMEREQKKLYQASVLQLKESLESKTDSEFSSEKIQVLAQLTRLRQICCDPALVYEDYKGTSAKLEALAELLQNVVSGGHKALIFSQFTSMLEIIEQVLQREKLDYYCLTGATSKEKRLAMVEQFNKDQVPVFLISLKAGGTGLNLVGADIVIHYDPWWNDAAQNQATDRAHRIGQERDVTVYKMIAKDTIEEKILKLQETKKGLADSIISEGGVSVGALTKEDLMEILA